MIKPATVTRKSARETVEGNQRVREDVAGIREEGDEERRCDGKQDGNAQIGKTLHCG